MSTGRFCWHDLMSLDPEAGKRFYGDLLGWTFKTVDMGPGGEYTMFHDGKAEDGGFVGMKPEDGVPPHWMSYVTVEDCDAAVAKVAELGGKTMVGPLDIPGTGRFAVIADDQGAAISIIALQNETPEPGPDHRPAPGQVCWHSLAADDVGKARAFYGALFGWVCEEMTLGGDASSLVFLRNGQPVAGLGPQNGSPVPYWALAIAVADLDVAHEKAIGLGATGLVPPLDLGTMGRMSVVQDPTGAAFSLFQSLE